MNITKTKFSVVLAISVATLTVGACLSKEEADLNVDNDDGGGNTPANQAPVISGNPPQAVTVGSSYSFTPTASDPDGDTMTFSITNRPDWATFSNNTGTLSGTPTLGSAGTTLEIVISVSDGDLRASLSPFEVDVVQDSLGSVTLGWTPPTANGDGTTLNDLVAYKFYYGMQSGQYTSSVRVDNPGIASYVVQSLVPDTYYFAATVVNSLGVESRFSNEAIYQVL